MTDDSFILSFKTSNMMLKTVISNSPVTLIDELRGINTWIGNNQCETM